MTKRALWVQGGKAGEGKQNRKKDQTFCVRIIKVERGVANHIAGRTRRRRSTNS